MAISRAEVQRVAELARLQLTDEEENQLTEQLSKIIDFVDKLSELDTQSVEPLGHTIDIVNAFREDRVTNKPSPETLLANAPAKDETFFQVPKILE